MFHGIDSVPLSCCESPLLLFSSFTSTSKEMKILSSSGAETFNALRREERRVPFLDFLLREDSCTHRIRICKQTYRTFLFTPNNCILLIGMGIVCDCSNHFVVTLVTNSDLYRYLLVSKEIQIISQFLSFVLSLSYFLFTYSLR